MAGQQFPSEPAWKPTVAEGGQGGHPARPFSFGRCTLGDEWPALQVVSGRRQAQLKSEIRRLCPKKPGVYGMLDRDGEVIYIGKAKELRTRLLSYFCRRRRPPRALRILRHTTAIVWEVAGSEFAALCRELELIRRWRPRWNIQGQPLRRRLAFVCLGRAPAPYVFLVRRPPRKHLALLGPIPLGRRARDAVRRLNDCLGLRDCPQSQEMFFAGDAELFPMVRSPGCLRHEFGACLGPCAGACSRNDYGRQVQAAQDFLCGVSEGVVEELQSRLKAAAAALEFERAAVLRDKLLSLRWLSETLARQRRQARASFIYRVRTWSPGAWWYLIHGGRVVAALEAPRTEPDFRRAAELIDAVYHKKNSAALLDSYEHHDSRALVALWFGRHPRERRRTLSPEQALKLCGHSLAEAPREP